MAWPSPRGLGRSIPHLGAWGYRPGQLPKASRTDGQLPGGDAVPRYVLLSRPGATGARGQTAGLTALPRGFN
jgi:hypothetical protein